MTKNIHRRQSEADARVLIDRRLDALGWKNIWRETAPPDCRAKLRGKKPDYVLCHAGSEKPAAVVEAKRKKRDLAGALRQGLDYARRIGCPVVFASDGVLTLTAHTANDQPLMINSEEVRDFLPEETLRHFAASNIWVREDVVKNSRQLISIFNKASKLLRAEGMVNIDAFAEFSEILFFKIVSETEAAGRGRRLRVRWGDIENSHGTPLLELYRSALIHLGKEYPGVFSVDTGIKNPATLEKIVTCLSRYSFSEIHADVKGGAYEHFLRQYNRQKNELAQYFTPRHVVAMMVALADPKFGERVYDPFCGTGGMLLEAFRYVEKNTDIRSESDRKRLRNETVFGGDISRSASAAKMNMILAGDGHSNIVRANSLETSVDGNYDVVITNIPFVAADEKAFVRHCLSACAGRRGGRACIIVPERMLNVDKYADFREEMLRDWVIRRVVSLPREVFRGVTSAKTSVIYALWKGENSPRTRRNVIPYVKVRNDGYTLDTNRDPLPGKNDLDEVLETRDMDVGGHVASAKNHYALKPELDNFLRAGTPTAALRDLVKIKNVPIRIAADTVCREPGMHGKEHVIELKKSRFGYNVQCKRRKLISPGDLVFSRMHTQDGLFAYSKETFHGTGTHLVCEVLTDKIDRDFLFYALDKVVPLLYMEDTTGRENYKAEVILGLEIPLPSLTKQRALVKRLRAARGNCLRAQEKMAAAKEDFQRGLWKK